MFDEMVEVIARQVDNLDDGQTHATLRASVEGNVNIAFMAKTDGPGPAGADPVAARRLDAASSSSEGASEALAI